jgi:hypothetical protein
MNFPVNVAGAVQDACNDLAAIPIGSASSFSSSPAKTEARRAPRIGASRTEGVKARLYVVVIQRVPAPEFPARPTIDNYPFPAITVQLLSKITADSGGRLYRGGWDLKSILAAARKP